MIGILDSGVGGLSVLREVCALMPGAEISYVGDCAFCPYGTKSTAELRNRIGTVVESLLAQGARVIVLACNSATIQAVHWCREQWPQVPFVGMEPGVKPAVAATRTKVIGVLATEASLTGDMFQDLVSKHSQDCQILTRACPKFVELVEEGLLEGESVEVAVREYGQPLVDAGADVLVLGCTHYPFLKNAIAQILPNTVLIDTGPAVARRVHDVLAHIENEQRETAQLTIFTSGPPETMTKLLKKLLPEIEGTVQHLPLSS